MLLMERKSAISETRFRCSKKDMPLIIFLMYLNATLKNMFLLQLTVEFENWCK